MRDQTRLHGKPAVSFFNDVHGRRSAAGEKPKIDETKSIPSKGKTSPESLSRKRIPITDKLNPKLGGLSNPDKVYSSKEGDLSTGDAQAARCRRLSTMHHSRCNATGQDKGHRGSSRQNGMGHARNDGDGVCSLEAKLVLLDGVLHDPQMKALVQNTLGYNR